MTLSFFYPVVAPPALLRLKYVDVCATDADHVSPLALSLLQNSHDGRNKMGAGA